jgi:RNA polymerase I-specific transcription initiation factor RRN3
MIEYCPELGARVWIGLVDKMLRIDVEITNSVEDDDDDDDEDDEDDEEDDMIRPGAPAIDPFDILVSQDVPHDGDETDDDDGEDSDDDEDPDIDALSTDEELESETERIIDEVKAAEKVAQQRRLKRANLKALRCKLDAMLTHFFRHLNESMGSSERGMSAAELGAQLHNTTLGSGSSSANSTPRGSRPATPTTATPTTSSAVLRPPPTPAQSLAHFQTLLNLFSRQILPTSATQHLPFVMFLCASFTPAHTELFLHLLVLQALYARTTDAPTLASQPVPLAQRSAATVYIGSLVCRARFVSDEQARTVAQYLLAYVEGKLTQAREQPLYTLDELPLFYAVCQAIMMIFCFRWRAFRGMTVSDDQVAGEMEMDDLGDEETGGEWMRDLDTLQRARPQPTARLQPDCREHIRQGRTLDRIRLLLLHHRGEPAGCGAECIHHVPAEGEWQRHYKPQHERQWQAHPLGRRKQQAAKHIRDARAPQGAPDQRRGRPGRLLSL